MQKTIFTLIMAAVISAMVLMQANAQNRRGSIISPTIPDIHNMPAVDPLRAKYDNACANLEAAVSVGVTGAIVNDWIAKCSHHPNRSRCEQTVEYIRATGRGVPTELVCHP